MSNNNFPLGWIEIRIQALIAHYGSRTEEEILAELEVASVTQRADSARP